MVEGDPKAPFSLATTPRCKRECNSIDPYLTMLSVKQGDIKYHFWIFGMTRPGIDWDPGLLNHWWTLYSLDQWPYIYIYWQHFFIHAYLIEHFRHFLSTYFLLILSSWRIDLEIFSGIYIIYIYIYIYFTILLYVMFSTRR